MPRQYLNPTPPGSRQGTINLNRSNCARNLMLIWEELEPFSEKRVKHDCGAGGEKGSAAGMCPENAQDAVWRDLASWGHLRDQSTRRVRQTGC